MSKSSSNRYEQCFEATTPISILLEIVSRVKMLIRVYEVLHCYGQVFQEAILLFLTTIQVRLDHDKDQIQDFQEPYR
jgi:hypothetical protein